MPQPLPPPSAQPPPGAPLAPKQRTPVFYSVIIGLIQGTYSRYFVSPTFSFSPQYRPQGILPSFFSRRGFIPKCGDLVTLRRKLVPSHNLLLKGKSPTILFQSPGFPKQHPHLSLQRCDMSWVKQNVSRPPHHQSGKIAPYAASFFNQKYQCVRKHVFFLNAT